MRRAPIERAWRCGCSILAVPELNWMRRDWLKFLALLLPVLTGCLSHTRKLQQPKLAWRGPWSADAVQLVEAVKPSLRPGEFVERNGGFCCVGGRHPQRPAD